MEEEQPTLGAWEREAPGVGSRALPPSPPSPGSSSLVSRGASEKTYPGLRRPLQGKGALQGLRILRASIPPIWHESVPSIAVVTGPQELHKTGLGMDGEPRPLDCSLGQRTWMHVSGRPSSVFLRARLLLFHLSL